MKCGPYHCNEIFNQRENVQKKKKTTHRQTKVFQDILTSIQNFTRNEWTDRITIEALEDTQKTLEAFSARN